MTTNLQLAKLSDLVYQPNGGTTSQVQAALGAEWVRYANPDDLGLSFTTGYFAAAYRNTVTGEIVIAHRGLELTDRRKSKGSASNIFLRNNHAPSPTH